mgnify:CR=1 FL=1
MIMSGSDMINLDRIHLSGKAKTDLAIFINQIASFYKNDLLSITAFGSRVTGDQSKSGSDLNLLVIYSDLNIADLHKIAGLAKKFHKKHHFAPRFLSRRNLFDSAKYFALDIVNMKDSRAVIYGSDILEGLDVSPSDLRWQISHEIKKMRMRLKQQFWMISGDKALMSRVVARRFTSLLYLMRGLFYLKFKSAPVGKDDIISEAVSKLGINSNALSQLKGVKDGTIKGSHEVLIQCFDHLMNIIRTIDEETGKPTA